jgi:hypothetical protein
LAFSIGQKRKRDSLCLAFLIVGTAVHGIEVQAHSVYFLRNYGLVKTFEMMYPWLKT